MARTIEEAREEAERRAAIQRQFIDMGGRGAALASMYILERCYCLGQGGVAQQFHVHSFTPDALAAWREERQEIIVHGEVSP